MNPKDPDKTSDQSKARSRAGAPDNGDQPIQFAGSTLGSKRHICAFFNSPEEEYRVLLPFIKEGLERGEKAFHVFDPELCEAHRRQLESGGIDVTSAEQQGDLELFDWNDWYLPDGRFEGGRMFAKWETVLDGAREKGYSRTRVIAHLDWPQEDVNVLLEYEANFNNFAPGNRDPVICTYDVSKHSGAFIIEVMRTHPMIIVGGILHENPFFVPPDEFIKELREAGGNATQA